MVVMIKNFNKLFCPLFLKALKVQNEEKKIKSIGYFKFFHMIQENQIFIGLFIALINGIFALRLGIAMYKRS